MTIAKNYPINQALLIDVSNTTLHSAEEFERLQRDNPDLQMELTEDGKLSVMSPTSNERLETATGEAEVFPPVNSPIADSISSGKYQLPELTPEETARRVATIEKHQQKRAQMWNSLTPEEQAESNRQFENLYKLLEDARK
jgi:hypothetical protein